ncbi:uncharacterized protein LOC110979672 [Acanthaster planci]|uniref:Uncharacterized protein LOC110979672 n=1 Tax=Acanthaster planci TaxID=133434 RepID=A0A8B7YDP2_ACAPL|nr:uncharacterized protein LOC110979672 [Acanthaster planci]
MSARPARPVVQVRHRYLAGDKPQFLIENASKRPEARVGGTSTEPRRAPKKKDVKLTVSRSADVHTARRGPGSAENRLLGKIRGELSSKRNISGANPTPIIIGDLWKPMQTRHSTTQEKVDFTNNATAGSHSQRVLAYDCYNTRREAKKLLHNSQSGINQLLRNQRERVSGSRYHAQSAGPSTTRTRNHRIGEVAGYQIFGGELPRTSVYNLNERIVSSVSDLSSVSFGSVELDATDNGIAAGLERLSGSKDWIQDVPKNEDQSFPCVVEDGDPVLSGKMLSNNPTPSSGAITARNIERIEHKVNLKKTGSEGKNGSVPFSRLPVDNTSRQRTVGNTVESGLVAGDTFRFYAPSEGQVMRNGALPKSMDESRIVGRENGTKELPDCSMCPMCRAEAALQAAGLEEVTLGNSEKLGEGELGFLSAPRVESNIFHRVGEESLQESEVPVLDLVAKETTDQTLERRSRSSIQLFSEVPRPPSFVEHNMIDSYGKNGISARQPHTGLKTVNQRSVAQAVMLDVDLKAKHKSAETAGARSPKRDLDPRPGNGAIVVMGNRLARGDRFEQHRPSPPNVTKWQHVDVALPSRQTSPRGTVTGTGKGGTPDLSPNTRYPPASSAMDHRIPLIIWKKLQQLESPPQHDNRKTDHGYGSQLAVPVGSYGSRSARFAPRQVRGGLGEEFTPRSSSTTSSIVVHIPTAGVTSDDIDCPPNSPTAD